MGLGYVQEVESDATVLARYAGVGWNALVRDLTFCGVSFCFLFRPHHSQKNVAGASFHPITTMLFSFPSLKHLELTLNPFIFPLDGRDSQLLDRRASAEGPCTYHRPLVDISSLETRI